jgi:hypothetical protein
MAFRQIETCGLRFSDLDVRVQKALRDLRHEIDPIAYLMSELEHTVIGAERARTKQTEQRRRRNEIEDIRNNRSRESDELDEIYGES